MCIEVLKQILQSLRDGVTEIAEVPAPMAGPGQVLDPDLCTLVSAGTERMLVDFGRAGLIEKAMQQPDRVRQAFQKMKTDGLLSTVEAIRSKLDEPVALGYCNVGRVRLPRTPRTPRWRWTTASSRTASTRRWSRCRDISSRASQTRVDDETAAFTVLGAIALQGVRLAQPTLGEAFVVTGLGLVGLLAVQILRANGCRVLGIDNNPDRLAIARRFGAETVDLSNGRKIPSTRHVPSRADAESMVFCSPHRPRAVSRSPRRRRCAASAGGSCWSESPGLDLDRADFYEKELTFQVSCSYGPGRYDPDYEAKGQDYPVGFVRWTEQRNFEAVLDMMVSGAIDVAPLISHRFPIDEAAEGLRPSCFSRAVARDRHPISTTRDRAVATLLIWRPPRHDRPARRLSDLSAPETTADNVLITRLRPQGRRLTRSSRRTASRPHARAANTAFARPPATRTPSSARLPSIRSASPRATTRTRASFALRSRPERTSSLKSRCA